MICNESQSLLGQTAAKLSKHPKLNAELLSNLNAVLFFRGTNKGSGSSRLIFHQVGDYYTQFLWGSIASESHRHQGTVLGTCPDECTSTGTGCLWFSTVSIQVSLRLLCEVVTHPFREAAMYLWNLQQKDLKAIFFPPIFSL